MADGVMEKIYFLLIRVINKALSLRKSVRYIRSRNKKNALISYLIVPETFIPFYYRLSHNNRYTAWLLINVLKARGYNVYSHDYLDSDSIDYSVRYDLFIGHNKTFASIAAALKNSPRKILLTTGLFHDFGNKQNEIRISEVNKRKNAHLKVYDDNVVSDLSPNFSVADSMMMMGNEFVKNTYPSHLHAKINLINNVTLHPYFERGQTNRTGNFLFISSVGQVHRGLDLVLDLFSKMSNKVYVLSLFEKERDFVELYRKELYETASVIPAGYVALNSPRFVAIVNDVDFIILPSCAEGQSSSVINMMAYGLIPIITENDGIPDTDEIGIKIKSLDLQGVSAAVAEALALSNSEFDARKKRVMAMNNLFTGEGFSKRIGEILDHE